ncbi:hypothetical protein FGE12_04460 [Aggregicoccus sp. 17bor-14]|uniref:hypothetical protein n=1 Tax=Myxococcaceae TaxID=31 RepID=UPI00129C6708|nr:MULTISPECIES: hypothetical protein [Myxococcaceae]MBF5041629.1 hypothetical protein [Simulacricoccus sp. 17bor-14]MRI87414.1 hypothetical protein [Aggregicoccus sp. 17bor-14]
MLEGLLSDMLRRYVPDYFLVYQPMHGGEAVGTAAGVTVVLALCILALARALRTGETSPLWTSVVFVEVLRYGAGLPVLARLLTDDRFREALPYSVSTFLQSAFFWWPVLLLASLVASLIVVRRLPRPAALCAACVVVGVTAAVLVLHIGFERSTMPLYYLRLLRGL